MPKSVTVKITGLRELGARLRALDAAVQKTLAGKATGRAASVIRKRARQLAPIAPEPYEIEGVKVQPGNIPKNIVAKRLPKNRTTLTSEHIVTVRGKAKYGYASRVGALQEFGTVNHPPQPFLRPAFEQEKMAATGQMIDTLRAGIDRVAKGGKA